MTCRGGLAAVRKNRIESPCNWENTNGKCSMIRPCKSDLKLKLISHESTNEDFNWARIVFNEKKRGKIRTFFFGYDQMKRWNSSGTEREMRTVFGKSIIQSGIRKRGWYSETKSRAILQLTGFPEEIQSLIRKKVRSNLKDECRSP